MCEVDVTSTGCDFTLVYLTLVRLGCFFIICSTVMKLLLLPSYNYLFIYFLLLQLPLTPTPCAPHPCPFPQTVFARMLGAHRVAYGASSVVTVLVKYVFRILSLSNRMRFLNDE